MYGQGKHEKLFTANITDYFTCVQTVNTRPLLVGEAPGARFSFKDAVGTNVKQLVYNVLPSGKREKNGALCSNCTLTGW